MEELRKRFEKCLEEDDLDLENVWLKFTGPNDIEPNINEILKFIGYSMGMKDSFYKYLDEVVDLDHLKTFCDSLSQEDKMKLIKGDNN